MAERAGSGGLGEAARKSFVALDVSGSGVLVARIRLGSKYCFDAFCASSLFSPSFLFCVSWQQVNSNYALTFVFLKRLEAHTGNFERAKPIGQNIARNLQLNYEKFFGS